MALAHSRKKLVAQDKKQKKEQKEEAEKHLQMQRELVRSPSPGLHLPNVPASACWGPKTACAVHPRSTRADRVSWRWSMPSASWRSCALCSAPMRSSSACMAS